MKISNSTFLVTGGASGLGAACCRRFAAAGGNIVIADVAEQAGRQLAAELGDCARYCLTDVTSDRDMEAAIQTTVTEFGPLDGLIACAGILGGSRVVGREGPHDLDQFRHMIDVNLVGTFNAVRCAAHSMSQNHKDQDENERGVIVMTASIAAWEGQIGQVAYAASKGAIASMTLPMARELGRFGVRVVSIAPGIFGTPMMDSVSDEIRDSLHSQIPFPPRFGKPDEFAALAQHIVENQMLNGSVVRLDGAIRMGSK